MSAIRELIAREVLDSRGLPTVEVEAFLESGARGVAIVPSGASTGSREALELRDGDPARHGGKGVLRAAANVTGPLFDAVAGLEALDQVAVDAALCEADGTPKLSRLGANAVLGVSLAVARASAEELDLPLWRTLGGTAARVLPVPLLNVINGGAHADNTLDIQEFMVAPVGAPTFREAMRAGCEVYQQLRMLLKERKLSTGIGDEGGFAPDLRGAREALNLLATAVERTSRRVGDDIVFALDVAANELHDGQAYNLAGEGRKGLTSSDLIAIYRELGAEFPLFSIEDGLAEDDWDGWQGMTRDLGAGMQLIGDDLFVTDTALLQRGIRERSANAVLVKVNQIGTLTRSLDCIRMAKQASFATIVSHRSGETEDTTIADIAVATNAGQIKTGAPARGERTAKYNRLLRIEEELGSAAEYAGRSILRGRPS